MPTDRDLPDRLHAAALALGFAKVGYARAEPFAEAGVRWREWLARGFHGDLHWMSGPEDRADPTALAPFARSLVVVALRLDGGAPPESGGAGLRGVVARYARGPDYHDAIRHRLRRLAAICSELAGRPVAARWCVDTAPLLEREAAVRAGLGFIGKNGMLIVPGLGSHVVLGALLVDLDLPPARPLPQACGSCRLCLDACPTRAFAGPRQLDARRCIAYLTIEHPGSYAEELRERVGLRVFGCDACQDPCPYNAAPPREAAPPDPLPKGAQSTVELERWLELGSASYRKLVRGTALRRAHRQTLARNAAVALGNSADPTAAAPLMRALRSSPLPLVREHAAWGLGELVATGALDRETASVQLERAAETDPDPAVAAAARRAWDRLRTLQDSDHPGPGTAPD